MVALSSPNGADSPVYATLDTNAADSPVYTTLDTNNAADNSKVGLKMAQCLYALS